MFLHSIAFGAAIGSTIVAVAWIALTYLLMMLGADLLGVAECTEDDGHFSSGVYSLLLTIAITIGLWILSATWQREPVNGWIVTGSAIIAFVAMFLLTSILVGGSLDSKQHTLGERNTKEEEEEEHHKR